MPAPKAATCIYRFLGLIPRPGEPLLVDDDPAGIMGQKSTIEVAGRSIAVRVRPHQDAVLGGEPETQLRRALHENHTFDELLAWAKTIDSTKDRENAIVAIEVAKRANDKGHIARTLLPSRRALFLGIVAPNQPPVAVTAPFGLNHARVIVEGVVPVFNFGLVPNHDKRRMPLAGHLVVCGTKANSGIEDAMKMATYTGEADTDAGSKPPAKRLTPTLARRRPLRMMTERRRRRQNVRNNED